jgi:hypothetical protein
MPLNFLKSKLETNNAIELLRRRIVVFLLLLLGVGYEAVGVGVHRQRTRAALVERLGAGRWVAVARLPRHQAVLHEEALVLALVPPLQLLHFARVPDETTTIQHFIAADV